MGYDCPCGTSVGTRAHWCEWKQEQHAERVEKLLALIAAGVAAVAGVEPTSAAVTELVRLTDKRREAFE